MTELAGLVFRAGGGQGFDGGGGGASGGGVGLGGGGGGGFFFFGGGGGGAATGTVLVVGIVLAMVVLRLSWPRWRGGHRRGDGLLAGAPPSPPTQDWNHDDQPAINTARGDLFPGTATAAASAPESSATGLAAIASHDPGFSPEVFVEQAQRTFFVVEEAWTRRQPGLSRQVMADGLWQQHRTQIQGYIDAKKRNVLEDLAVADLTIIAAHHDSRYDTIAVRVHAACADYDVDDGDGKVIRGNKHVGQWAEDWTFQRAGSAVTPAEGGTLTAKCPNCGAPLDLDLAGTCKYCKAPVSSGAYDWVLARIAQVPGYASY